MKHRALANSANLSARAGRRLGGAVDLLWKLAGAKFQGNWEDIEVGARRRLESLIAHSDTAGLRELGIGFAGEDASRPYLGTWHKTFWQKLLNALAVKARAGDIEALDILYFWAEAEGSIWQWGDQEVRDSLNPKIIEAWALSVANYPKGDLVSILRNLKSQECARAGLRHMNLGTSADIRSLVGAVRDEWEGQVPWSGLGDNNTFTDTSIKTLAEMAWWMIGGSGHKTEKGLVFLEVAITRGLAVDGILEDKWLDLVASESLCAQVEDEHNQEYYCYGPIVNSRWPAQFASLWLALLPVVEGSELVSMAKSCPVRGFGAWWARIKEEPNMQAGQVLEGLAEALLQLPETVRQQVDKTAVKELLSSTHKELRLAGAGLAGRVAKAQSRLTGG